MSNKIQRTVQPGVTNDANNAPTQRDRFIEAARQLGADEDEAAFKAKLAQIARQKPKGDVPPAPEPPQE